MNTRELLKQRLATLDALTRGGSLRRGSSQSDDVAAQLTSQWNAEKRLIKRVLSEPADPAETLSHWRERTENFRDKFPEREGWTDQQGNDWNAALVLQAIDNLFEHIENWSSEVETFDDE
ncbi:MAG: hypothetical protein M5U01_31375 [Ardenticatenaceae bacterium]|nr:hypothetical protein [Ardenticatenaceae bacterium]